MKIILIVLILLIFRLGIAENCKIITHINDTKDIMEIKTDVPEWLKGATITIRLRDGSQSTVSAEKFKVVPRKQQFVVTRTETNTIKTCTVNDFIKNRISALGGIGYTGKIKTEFNGDTAIIRPKIGATGGLQYQRKINSIFSLGVQSLTNGTSLATFGVDF